MCLEMEVGVLRKPGIIARYVIHRAIVIGYLREFLSSVSLFLMVLMTSVVLPRTSFLFSVKKISK